MEEAILKLKDNVEPNKIFRFRGGTKVFQGNVYDSNFTISRIILYKNSFLPQIKGSINTDTDSTTIGIKMYLHPFVIVFMILWFLVVTVGCFASAIAFVNSLNQGNAFRPEVLIPFGMLAFGICLCTVPFWIEVKKARNELDRIFNSNSE